MKLSKHIKVLSVLCLAAVLLAALVPGGEAAAAAAYEPLKVSLPYRHLYITTDSTVDSLFHYLVIPQDGAPLPAEADGNGGFAFQGVSGSGSKQGSSTVYDLTGTLTFTFSKPGIYSYVVKADLAADGKKENASRYTFEPRVTTINFFIVNAADGSMKLQMLTAEDDQDVKPNELEFDPIYVGPVVTPAPTASPTPGPSPKTGDTNNIALYLSLMAVSGLLIAGFIMLPQINKMRKGGGRDA